MKRLDPYAVGSRRGGGIGIRFGTFRRIRTRHPFLNALPRLGQTRDHRRILTENHEQEPRSALRKSYPIFSLEHLSAFLAYRTRRAARYEPSRPFVVFRVGKEGDSGQRLSDSSLG